MNRATNHLTTWFSLVAFLQLNQHSPLRSLTLALIKSTNLDFANAEYVKVAVAELDWAQNGQG